MIIFHNGIPSCMHTYACVCVVPGEGGRGGGGVCGCPVSVSTPLCVVVFVIHMAARRFLLSLRA